MEYFYCDSDGNLVPCSMLTWGRMMEDGHHVLFKTPIAGGFVSTVCLGFDHGWGVSPLFFETMVFDITGIDEDQDIQVRYGTYAEAKAGHEQIVQHIKSLLTIN